jgi:WD40 repeat protein
MDLPSESIVQNYDGTSVLVAATGSSTGALCIHRFNSIEEIGGNGDEDLFSSSSIEYFHTPRHHRKASSVAWRPAIHTNHVAIGLVGANASAAGNMSNPGQHQLHRRGGTKMRSGGSDREYCCFLWDIADTKQTMPLSKFAYNSPVASLAWMMDGQTLAVGGQQRTIQLYDLRASTDNNNKLPPLSAHAHESGVHGIEVHPHRPHLMATFCRSVGEPVKLFDIRRMDSVVSEIKLSNTDNHNTGTSTASIPKSFSAQRVQQAKAEAIQWSLLEPGMLTVATGEAVQEYDTNSGARPSLVRMNRVSKSGKCIKAIALYRGKPGIKSPKVVPSSENSGGALSASMANEEKSERNDVVDYAQNRENSDRLLSLLYPKRLLAVLEDQSIEDMAKDMNAPLAISRRDGRLVHALGPHLFIGASSEGPAAMERIIKRGAVGKAREEEDISATMMRRARCLQTNPYSMNPERNIKLMSQEVASEELHHEWNKSSISLLPKYSNRALLRLWGWIERVESLSFQDVDDTDDDPRMIRDILSAGVLQLLNFQKDGGNDAMGKEQMFYSETLAWNVYDSVSRRAALSSCGWAGKFDLTNVMAECEALGEYERSAALAVWHEDMGAAVEALQRASEAIQLQARERGNHSSLSVSPQYAETLSLISMCIAGYGGKTESQRSVWTRACASLLQRDDMSLTRAKNSTRVAYLRAVCEFLMNAGTNESLLKVLENSALSLCDRVAFACRFLHKKELTTYLLRCVEICQQQGDLEGLAITGLSKPGIKILQSFVDHYTDVQTAALVVSRVILPSDWASERKICFEWVESYRSLLNFWQMWQSRAMFDVDRADLLRRVKARSGGAGYQRRIPNPRNRQSPRPPDPDIVPRVPAQLEARCNYCNSPLSLKRQEGTTNQWLSKMQPLLNCCPQCRKPLPRCSVCLLSMGSLNPYMELTRARQGPRGIGKNISSPDDLTSLSSMNFAEWYTWCMR